MGSVSTLGGGLSVISGSEANFMIRQAESGDISQLSITGQEEAFGLDAASVAAATASAIAEKVNEKMKDRIASLEKQVKALTGTVDRRDQELEKSREREMKILSDLETVRKDSMRELHAFRERYETEILNLKETHAREMALLIIPAHDKSTEQSVDSPSKAMSKKAGGHKSTTVEGNSLLLQQLEEMRQELRKIHEISENEKRLLKAEAAAKLASQEKQLKSEIAIFKSEIAAFEDRYSALNDDLQDSRAQQEAMSRACQQLERSRQDALDAQSKLRADLSNMQQTVNATYRLESSQGLGVGVDADTAIRLSEAKFEAKERQLQNKVN
jgi:chromosome segregation ATPase